MVDHGELLQRLGETPRLARAAGDRPVTDGWTPTVVVGHLAYVDRAVWLPRLREMASRELPVWEWWEPDGVDWWGLYGGRPYDEVVDELELARNEVVSYLAELPADGWARRARHTTFGELAVAGLCEEVLAHDHEHLAQLRGS